MTVLRLSGADLGDTTWISVASVSDLRQFPESLNSQKATCPRTSRADDREDRTAPGESDGSTWRPCRRGRTAPEAVAGGRAVASPSSRTPRPPRRGPRPVGRKDTAAPYPAGADTSRRTQILRAMVPAARAAARGLRWPASHPKPWRRPGLTCVGSRGLGSPYLRRLAVILRPQAGGPMDADGDVSGDPS